jgi:hypothetical protein
MNKRTLVIENYETPISHYPNRKLGKAEIRRYRSSSGATYWAEGVRGYLYYEYAKAATLIELKIKGKCWMTDDPQYVWSLQHFAAQSKGRVLVAGLGLGIVVHMLTKNPNVTQIDVVDRELDVIQLVQPLLPEDPRIHIHHDDFYDWCDRASANTDYVPDTVIWDLAVGSDGKISEGKEILFAMPLVAGRFMPMKWDGKNWVERKDFKPFEMFVHGFHRDPAGEELVKTPEFKRARSIVLGHAEKEMLA